MSTTDPCNGLDDDCDTVCDSGYECCAGAATVCTNAGGIPATRTCSAACALGACCSGDDVCDNGCDDDCDGVTDEDCCAGATPIAPGTASITGNTCGGANGYGASCGASAAPDIAYACTAPRWGTATFSLCGSSYDTVLHVHGYCTGGFVGLACNDDYSGCGTRSQVSFAVVAGATYYVVVDGFGSSCGSFTMAITDPP